MMTHAILVRLKTGQHWLISRAISAKIIYPSDKFTTKF